MSHDWISSTTLLSELAEYVRRSCLTRTLLDGRYKLEVVTPDPMQGPEYHLCIETLVRIDRIHSENCVEKTCVVTSHDPEEFAALVKLYVFSNSK